MKRLFTIGELTGYYRLPAWKLRRAVVAIDGVQRAGLYRLIPAGRLRFLEAELVRRGWLPAPEVVAR